MSPSLTDWGTAGAEGFARDPLNEQVGTLAANQVFTGGWTRVNRAASYLILYGTHVPFSMQIQWSRDGVTQDSDPFATITPQVRFALGLYSVISPQSTFFRPYYRIRIANGPSPQLFAVSDALILATTFQGYDISVDGPIPVLGLAKLGIGLAWAKSPTGWQPVQLTAGLNQRVALAENLLGSLPVTVGNFPAFPAFPADYPSVAVLAKLEQVRALLAAPLSTTSTTAGGTPVHLSLVGTTVVKATPGVLERIVVNKISAAAVVLLTVYNGLTVAAPVLASVQLGATAPGSSGVIAPASLDYFAAFSTGLTVQLSAIGADVTIVYR